VALTPALGHRRAEAEVAPTATGSARLLRLRETGRDLPAMRPSSTGQTLPAGRGLRGLHGQMIAVNGYMATATASTVSPYNATTPRSQVLRRRHSSEARDATAT
jgi:hypothetical protein